MPPKRTPGTKKVKSYKTEAERKRWERANETAEETRQRLDKQRELQSASRNRLSGNEKEARVKTHRDDQSRYLHNLTDEKTDERLDRQREYQSRYIDSQTDEQTAERLDKKREYQSRYIDSQTDEQTAERLDKKREYQSRYIDSLTEEKTAERLDKKREYQSNYIDSHTEEQTAERLDKKREYQSNYIDFQTEEQTSERLDRHKEYLSSLREQETAEINTSHLQVELSLYTKSLNSKLALNFARSQTASEVSDNLVVEYSFGSMGSSCSFCDAKFWESEKLLASTKSCLKFSLCCGQSKVVLPPLATPPDLLLHLLTATDSRGKAFRDHIRSYNTALGFASLGVNLDKELANAKKGVYTFRIHGMVHHSIGQLLPREGQPRAFAQIYIYDGTPEAELEYRQQHLGERSLRSSEVFRI